MRITDHQKKAIISSIKTTDPDAKVWLFGSRVDDNKKGGDIDIAILSDEINKDLIKKIKIKQQICDMIGDQKIDIVTSSDGQEAIFKLAMSEGIELT